jgi:hypothetical protein
MDLFRPKCLPSPVASILLVSLSGTTFCTRVITFSPHSFLNYASIIIINIIAAAAAATTTTTTPG